MTAKMRGPNDVSHLFGCVWDDVMRSNRMLKVTACLSAVRTLHHHVWVVDVHSSRLWKLQVKYVQSKEKKLDQWRCLCTYSRLDRSVLWIQIHMIDRLDTVYRGRDDELDEINNMTEIVTWIVNFKHNIIRKSMIRRCADVLTWIFI